MRRFRLLSANKSDRFSLVYSLSAVVIWATVSAMLMSWQVSARADDSMITPFSLVEQSGRLTREDLREIFFGRRTRWPDGSQLRVYVLPDQHPIHIRFAKEILGVYPYQLRSAWDRMIYSGTGAPPVVVESLDQMLTNVKQTPGAIGYIEQ